MTLDELSTYLQAQGIGTRGTDIFHHELPTTPDSCIVLNEYLGTSPEYVVGQSAPSGEWPRIQVLVRCGKGSWTVAQGWTKIHSIVASVETINGTLSGTVWRRCLALQPPAFMRKDENGRTELVCNLEVLKAVS